MTVHTQGSSASAQTIQPGVYLRSLRGSPRLFHVTEVAGNAMVRIEDCRRLREWTTSMGELESKLSNGEFAVVDVEAMKREARERKALEADQVASPRLT